MSEEVNLSKFILVTGGQRSGKSVFAEKMALRLSPRPTYVATAQIYDEEMRERVRIHKQRRSAHWINLECPLDISTVECEIESVVLIDCVTLWATNKFFEKGENPEDVLNELKRQVNILLHKKATFIFVTNEVGLGGTSENLMQRKFMDIQGLINQYLAMLSDEVYFLISGIPMRIK